MTDDTAPNLAPPPPPLPPTFAAAAAPDPGDDDDDQGDDSLEGVDLAEFGVGPSLEGADDANRRAAGGDGAGGRQDQELTDLRRRVNQAEDMIKRLWEQMPRRVPASEDTRVFPVTLAKTAGSDGSKTTAASWVYTATVGTTTIGTSLSPAWPRPNGKMAVATRGLCSKTAAGAVTLEIAYERPGTAGDCS